jgi:hypothetical protein
MNLFQFLIPPLSLVLVLAFILVLVLAFVLVLILVHGTYFFPNLIPVLVPAFFQGLCSSFSPSLLLLNPQPFLSPLSESLLLPLS